MKYPYVEIYRKPYHEVRLGELVKLAEMGEVVCDGDMRAVRVFRLLPEAEQKLIEEILNPVYEGEKDE